MSHSGRLFNEVELLTVTSINILFGSDDNAHDVLNQHRSTGCWLD